MAVWTLERLRTASCSVHEAGNFSNPNLTKYEGFLKG